MISLYKVIPIHHTCSKIHFNLLPEEVIYTIATKLNQITDFNPKDFLYFGHINKRCLSITKQHHFRLLFTKSNINQSNNSLTNDLLSYFLTDSHKLTRLTLEDPSIIGQTIMIRNPNLKQLKLYNCTILPKTLNLSALSIGS